MPVPKILIIEDETVVAMDIKRGLKGFGYEVVATAGTGPEAIQLAGQHRPDLVLMDIRLQGQMDGIEAGRQIREQFRIPIIFLTAYADASTVQRAKAAEPFGYLLKPFEDSELNTAIEIALHKRDAEALALGEAGEALRQSEERFKLLVESLKDYAVFLLDPKGTIITWNAGAERINGYTAPDVLGQHLSVLYSPEDIIRNKPDELLWTASHLGRAGEECWRMRKDGSRYWGDIVVTVLRDKEGTLAGFAEITRDITQKKEADEEIRKLNTTLEQRVQERTAELTAANRELEAFTYSVAHDLRGPLRGIRSYLSILEEMHSRLPLEATDYLARGSRCADHMSRLIDDLLKLAQLGRQVLQRRPVSLQQVAQEIVSELAHMAANRQVEWHISQLPVVPCDPGLVKQVFANLLENALKYTLHQDRAVIEVGVMQMRTENVFFVRDNGIGFNMKYADKLFQPFSRLHSEGQFQGTGIGLTIVERIITRHGGRIWAEAQENKGATFYFTLSHVQSKQSAQQPNSEIMAELANLQHS